MPTFYNKDGVIRTIPRERMFYKDSSNVIRNCRALYLHKKRLHYSRDEYGRFIEHSFRVEDMLHVEAFVLTRHPSRGHVDLSIDYGHPISLTDITMDNISNYVEISVTGAEKELVVTLHSRERFKQTYAEVLFTIRDIYDNLWTILTYDTDDESDYTDNINFSVRALKYIPSSRIHSYMRDVSLKIDVHPAEDKKQNSTGHLAYNNLGGQYHKTFDKNEGPKNIELFTAEGLATQNANLYNWKGNISVTCTHEDNRLFSASYKYSLGDLKLKSTGLTKPMKIRAVFLGTYQGMENTLYNEYIRKHMRFNGNYLRKVY